MSQSVLTATLAFAIAVLLTAVIAAATSAAGTSSRIVKLIVVGTSIALVTVALQRTGLRINLTGSMPIGAYALSAAPADVMKRGMLVAACPPLPAAAIGRRRGYLGTGPCVGGTELLVKCIAAIPGDEVDVTAAGVVVNGRLLAHSRAVPHDRLGRELAPWPVGHYQLNLGQFWLYAANDRSWDSRYWGPVSKGDIYGEAAPLL